MSCNANNNVLNSTIQSTLNSTTDYVVQLQILDGITNPPSCYSDLFSIYILNSSGSIKDYDNNVQVSYNPFTLTSNLNINLF